MLLFCIIAKIGVSGSTGEDIIRNSYTSSRVGYMGKYPYEGPNERFSRLVNW